MELQSACESISRSLPHRRRLHRQACVPPVPIRLHHPFPSFHSASQRHGGTRTHRRASRRRRFAAAVAPLSVSPHPAIAHSLAPSQACASRSRTPHAPHACPGPRTYSID